MKKFAKLLCAVLCVLFFASVLLSAGLAVHGHEHNCIGDECQCCQAVSLQQELMRLVLLGCFSASFALIFVQLLVNMNALDNKQTQNISLVADKVKLTA